LTRGSETKQTVVSGPVAQWLEQRTHNWKTVFSEILTHPPALQTLAVFDFTFSDIITKKLKKPKRYQMAVSDLGVK
jgi:hypothetical protein